MKIRLLAAFAVFSFLVSNLPAISAETNDVTGELKALISKIQTKLRENKKTEADLADEINEFDALLAKHKDEKTDEVAQVLRMKAQLYFEVLDNTDKGIELVKQLKSDFPDTKLGKSADDIIDQLKKQDEGKKIQ